MGGPFTLEQVTAATSFTTSRTCAQTSASELPATSAVETLLLEDAGEQASFEYYDEVTRAKSHRPDQSVQAEPSYQHASLQISPARQDKAVQITAEYRDQETQLTAHYVDQGVQSALSSEHLQVQDTRIHQAPSAANGKRIFHNQASQTDHDYSFVSKSPVQKDSKSPLLIIHAVEAGGQPHESRNSGHIVISENSESHSSTDIAFFTAKNCSTVSPTQRTEPLDFGVSLDPNTVTIEFPEGAIVHMLQRIRGGKIVIDPGLLPRARSSEALAQGKIYTPHQVRDQEPNCAARSSRSASSASYSVASSTSSPEKTSSSPPKVTTVEASKTAEDSHYSDARQQLTSQTHESAESFNYQHDPSTKTEAVRSGEAVADLIISAPELPLAAESGAQKRLDHVNGKQKAPSVAYLFESEDENPKEVGQASPTRPQTLGQFQSVPLIRVQRPSTDSEMMFRLGTRAVKPSPSAHPLVCAADPPAVPTDHVIIPPASPAKKVSRRERIKRKGRKKLILRKKVLRFLLGTELAERVSYDWSTTENTSRGGTGAAQVANDASGAVPTPVASRSQLPESALPLGITPLAPAQVDGSDCRSTVSGDSSSVTSLDTDTAPSISALDGLQEREAKRRAKKELKLQKKEQEHVEAYELAKTNLEALTSTPCIKCGGQRAFILNFVWENKNNMLKHEQPEMKRRHRKKAVTEYVESIECRCPLGTSTAAHGCPEAVSKAKEMYGCHISSFILAKS